MVLDTYADTGLLVAIDLVNRLVVRPENVETRAVLAEILAVDPPSVHRLAPRHAAGFTTLAGQLRPVLDDLRTGDEDTAATRLNKLLATHPAHPHLAVEHGRWRLHHHPADTALVPMWSAICAEALARFLANGYARRIGACDAPGCGRLFVDTTRNRIRRFCSTACQDRVKTAAARRRHAQP
ncbi:CGNR zinc finger domain-containing protein [Actinocatenispora rupis]|uniref:CGNR zinc finger domain-containing protein n=1 Tax=Actinocatenispora rupis TaxID=519421 RepID=UPI0019410CA7|nr:CGNR zinc finger domain-containing protein [Actinocatenispora rupis]